ncbi:extended synaptotagmin-2-like [Procambarus clarkii]|uniref:extended synaptotagmin-2-like n=1 Tax=Procambarus clarkii TaxID=6728 RepID=UPI0037442973
MALSVSDLLVIFFYMYFDKKLLLTFCLGVMCGVWGVKGLTAGVVGLILLAVVTKITNYIHPKPDVKIQEPSWVPALSMEQSQWPNKILRLLRPTLAVHIEDILQQLIVPKIRESFEDWPKFNLQLREMKSCAQEPQLLGVKVHDRTSSGDIVLDLKYGYTGDFELSISVLNIPICTTLNIQAKGLARMVLKRITPRPPFVGIVRIFPVTSPEVDLTFTGIAAYISMFESYYKDKVIEAIPWPFEFPLAEDGLSMEEFSAPSLQGVIRLRVTGTDNDGVTQCSFRQELQQFTACKPWNSVFEVLCYPHMRERGRGIEITARNTRNWLEVEDIITWKRLRKTFCIEGIPRTNLYIEATWHELVSQVGLLPMRDGNTGSASSSLSCGVLRVWVDYAFGFSSERGVRVVLNVGEKLSFMANSTEYPKDQERKLTIFERGYDYLITSLHEQKLKIVGQLVFEVEIHSKQCVEVSLNLCGRDCAMSGKVPTIEKDDVW